MFVAVYLLMPDVRLSVRTALSSKTMTTQPNSRPSTPLQTTPLSVRLWDFVGSMRFAVSILSVVAIASAIGTIIKQNESKLNYVDKFGPFWAEVFALLGMHDVYNQAWFLVMLVFLVVSTSICLIRNTPKMLHDMRSYKMHNRTKTLAHMPEHSTWNAHGSVEQITHNVAQLFDRMGYQVRASQMQGPHGTQLYFAAKRGRFNRLGYVLTHLAIVVICLGGLMDSELSIRAQVWFQGKQPLTNMKSYEQVPESGVLGEGTLSYRGSVRIPEGKSTDFVELTYDQNSYLLQSLPFWVRLNRFTVEYYSTGMPKLFASDVTIKDKETGQELSQTISVNHPLRYKGVALYQANFDANESMMHLKVHPLFGSDTQNKALDAQVGGKSEFPFADKKYTLEWRAFKPINVFPTNEALKGSRIEAFAHAMKPQGTEKQFQNFGASVTYVLRDDAGNAAEYVQYASPVDIDGAAVFVSGRRDSLESEFRYFRIPADADLSVKDFMRLRGALADPNVRKTVALRYAQKYPNASVGADKMAQGIEKTLTTFAIRGLTGLGAQIEASVPEAERDKIASSLVRVLEETLWDALQTSRIAAGLPERSRDEAQQSFIRLSLYGLSELSQYQSPVWVELSSMDIVQSSGLQATRSPGQWWVYLGSVMLVLGTLAMAFIRERRVWLHVLSHGVPQDALNPAEQWHVHLAMSSTRRTFDYHEHWQQVRKQVEQTLP